MTPQEEIKKMFYNRYTARHRQQVINRLEYFENWMIENRDIDDLENVNYNDINAFFELDLKSRGNKRSTNEKWRSLINTYYEFFREYQKKMEIPAKENPVPSNLMYKFTEPIDSDDDSEFEQKFLTYPTIEKVLKFYFFNDPKMYYFMSLLAYSGARVSEVCTIKTKDINISERRWISGRIPGFAKKGKVLYFIPKFFAKFILFQDYVNERKKDESNDFLFTFELSKNKLKSKYDFISPVTIRNRMNWFKKNFDIKEPINPHAFRDAINSERGKLGIPDRDLDFLLNQLPKGINRQHYMKRFKNWHELQKKYDQSFPYPPFSPLF